MTVSSPSKFIWDDPPAWFNLAVISTAGVGFVVAIVAAIIFGLYPTWFDIAVAVAMYVFTITGITVGFHRLFAHRTFQANAVVRATLAIAGCMSSQGTVTSWVSHHRTHHLNSDQPGDVHSPHLHGNGLWAGLRGLLHSHMGWIVGANWKRPFPHAGDLYRDSTVQTIDRLYALWPALSLVIPTAICGLAAGTWEGALRGLIWAGAVRMLLTFHHTFCVNSVCHLWGTRGFDTPERSRNNSYVAFMTLGEGWHNNHHAFPHSAKFGLKWWQFDFGWWCIQVMQRLGWVWEVKVPSQKEIDRKQPINSTTY